MNVNVKSSHDCRMLLDRIEKTLTTVSFDTNKIRKQPDPLCKDDTCVFKGLSEAILSNRAVWSSVEPHLNRIGQVLCTYDIDKVASFSDSDLDRFYTGRLKHLKIRSQSLRKRLQEIRDNARVFQAHGSIRNFIISHLNGGRIEDLRSQFIGTSAGLKLHGVGTAICSEFFNNIGVDEFKADSNTTRFFKRIGIAGQNASPDQIRAIGITIAENAEKPRVHVDSLIWHFCAENQGGICTKSNPKGHLCKLRTEIPRLCTYCDVSTVLGETSMNQEKEKLEQGRGPSVEPVTPERVMAIKQHLADNYIEDWQEKYLFLKTTNKDVHDWGCYIAGLVLTRSGKTPFRTADVKLELQRLIPEIFGQKYAKESRIQPADVRIDARLDGLVDYANGFPCLERTDRNVYRFLGFKEGIRRRYDNDALEKRFSEL